MSHTKLLNSNINHKNCRIFPHDLYVNIKCEKYIRKKDAYILRKKLEFLKSDAGSLIMGVISLFII